MNQQPSLRGSSAEPTPLLIGLPVLNAAGTIERAIDSLLSQTFRDFKLIISDNASTDGTTEICARLASDDRVNHVRRTETVSAFENFAALLQNADSEFFMFAAGDDWWSPTFVERNLAMLRQQPEAVMSVSQVAFANEPLTPLSGTRSLSGSTNRRLRAFLRNPSDNSRFYGIFRTDVFKDAVLRADDIFAADWMIMALTVLEGEHVEVPEILMWREETPRNRYRYHANKGFCGWLSRFLPNLPMNLALAKRLPFGLLVSAGPALAGNTLRSILNSPSDVIRSLGEHILRAKRSQWRR